MTALFVVGIASATACVVFWTCRIVALSEAVGRSLPPLTTPRRAPQRWTDCGDMWATIEVQEMDAVKPVVPRPGSESRRCAGCGAPVTGSTCEYCRGSTC